jgi:dTDP-4-dehydrorhamnose reductase
MDIGKFNKFLLDNLIPHSYNQYMTSTILILGNGHVGKYIQNYLAAFSGFSSVVLKTNRISDLGKSDLKAINPSFIINTAAKTDLKWCEENVKSCYDNNYTSVVHLFNLIRDTLGNEVPLIQFSSACVWKGPYKENSEPFGPYDTPNPLCVYTKSKVEADNFLIQYFNKYPIVILRPRLIYSEVVSPRNVLQKINSYPQLIDTPNSISSLTTISETLGHIIKCPKMYCGRIMCVYDQGITTPYAIGWLLYAAGCKKDKPELVSKENLNSWHYPPRIDAVLYDKFFEDNIKPPYVLDVLNMTINDYKINLSGSKSV